MADEAPVAPPPAASPAPAGPPPTIEQRVAAARAPGVDSPQASLFAKELETPTAAAPPGEIPDEPLEDPTEVPRETPPPAPEATPDEVVADDAEAVEVADLDGLAEYLGTDVQTLYELAIPHTVGGQRQSVKLSELKDGYTASAEARRAQEEAKTLREDMTRQRDAAVAQGAQHVAEAQNMVNVLEQAAVARFQNVPWDQLRQEDPSEWSAKRRELDEVKATLDGAKRAVQAQVQNYQAQAQANNTEVQQHRLLTERAALHAAWPEMANPDTADSERQRLRDYFQSVGFTDQEIDGASDHRLVLMGRDAMRFRETEKKTDAAKKKVFKLAKKVLSPGASQSKADQIADSLKGDRARLRETGKLDDAVSLLSRIRNPRS